MVFVPDAQARREIAARTACDDRTIRRVYLHPERCKSATHYRITQGAKALGYAPPPGRPITWSRSEPPPRMR